MHKYLGILLFLIGLAGIIYFSGATDSVKASLNMYPMSIKPPQDKISPLLKEKLKEGGKVPVVVVLTAPTDMAMAQQEAILPQLQAMGFELKFQILNVANAMAGEIPADKINELAQNPYVSEILYDGKIFKQFSLAPTTSLERALEQIHVDVVRRMGYTGKGVTVILIDSGIDNHHPWLAGKVIAEYHAYPTDKDWTNPHGTHCAGIIVSVAPDVKFVDVIALDEQGSARLSWILKALDYAYSIADKYKPCVCSCSWGAYPSDAPEFNEVRKAVLRLAEKMPVVFAAGNFGPSPKTIACPADADNGKIEVITVGAVDYNNVVAWFSSRGPDTYGIIHNEPNVVAPGVDIVSAKAGGGTIAMSGTSMACPFVSGVIALMLQKNPNLTDEQCLKILEETAKDLGPRGFDYSYGYGLVQADKAIEMVSNQPITVVNTSNWKSACVGFSTIVTLIGLIIIVRCWE